MKIAYIIESTSKSGGSYYQTLNLYDDIIKNFDKRHEIRIYTNKVENLKILKKNVTLYSLNLIDKIIVKASTTIFFRSILNFFLFKTSLEKLLLKDDIELIIFPNPTITHYTIRKIKFVSTIFDLCHLDHSQFPEVNNNEFNYREKLYNHLSKNACAIITNSLILKKKISKRYHFSYKKIFSIPFKPVKKNFRFKQNRKKNFFYILQIIGSIKIMR